MARLINPGVGECLDRLAILSLKIMAGEEAGRDTSHFQREAQVLSAQIALRRIPTEEVIALTAVNARLWEAEDQLRGFRAAASPDPAAVMQVAFRLQRLNDQRSEIIVVINKAAGDWQGEEKLR